MNSPTPENIDHWLFDWTEGNLSPEQEEKLRLFLLLNPEYDLDADAWHQTKVQYPEVSEAQVASFEFANRVLNNKEEKKRRVPIFWWIGATSLVLGIFASSIWLSPKKPTQISRVKPLNVQQTVSPKETINQSSKISDNTHQATSFTSEFSKPGYVGANLNQNQYNLFSNVSLDNAFKENLSISSPNPLEKTAAVLPMLKISFQRNPLSNNQSSSLAGEVEVSNRDRSSKISNRLRLSKSSALLKYAHKDGISNTLKDRVFCLSEKTPFDLNDGFVGNRSQTRIQSSTFFRDLNGSNEKISQQISFDAYIRNIKSGIGVVANFAQFGKGAISDWNIRLIYSPKIALSRYISFEPSIAYTMGQKQLDFSKVNNFSNFTYQSDLIQQFKYDPSLPIGKSLFYRDLSAGAILNLGPIYAGGKLDNLLQHQDNIHTNDFDTIDRANRTTTILLGTDFSANNGKIVFSPMVAYRDNGPYQQTELGATLQLNRWVLGANTSTQKAIGGLVGYQGDNIALFLQSSKSESILTHQPVYLHQITVRINSNISRKSRRYLYL